MYVAGAWFRCGKGPDLQRRDHGQSCAKGGGHESMFKKMGTSDPKACTEACIKRGGKYVLFNGVKTFYELGDQRKPEPFAGQKVEVTGSLNKATKTIHVTDIKAAS